MRRLLVLSAALVALSSSLFLCTVAVELEAAANEAQQQDGQYYARSEHWQQRAHADDDDKSQCCKHPGQGCERHADCCRGLTCLRIRTFGGHHEGICAKPDCTSTPTGVANAVWACPQTASGGSCAGSCDDGFTGTPGAFCSGGVWRVLGSCTPATSGAACMCNPDGVPNALWSCNPTPDGDSCQGSCAAGFTPSPAPSATCSSGAFTGVTGACVPDSCSGNPTGVANAVWACPTTPSGGTCTGACAQNFTGSPGAFCSGGVWQVLGSCTPGGSTCSDACTCTPAGVPNAVWGCGTAPDGSSCQGSCPAGFTPSPAPSATCSQGLWATSGACVPDNCTTTPTGVLDAAWNCTLPTADGATCVGSCVAGYSGTPVATCKLGNFTTAGSCSPDACTCTPAGVPNAVWGCGTTPDGSSCRGSCPAGYTPSPAPRATCSQGLWATSGACLPNNCTSNPTGVLDAAWNCTLPTADGATCVGSCVVGHSGTPVATCKLGNFTTAGSCSPDPCLGSPPVANTLWACSSLTANGGVCNNTSCASTFFPGPDLPAALPTASCANGTWATKGNCGCSTSTCCSAPPLGSPSNPGITTWSNCTSLANGASCSQTCEAPFTGVAVQSCIATSWIINQPCTRTGNARVVAIAAGAYHSCFALASGQAFCSGGNFYGALGDGTTTSRLTPVPVVGLSNVVAIAAGDYHSVFLLANGSAYATGYNAYGALGDNTTTNRLTPVRVLGLNNVAAISGGFYHTVFALTNGSAYATGYNLYGALGDNTTTNRLTPVRVLGLNNVAAISAGAYHTVFALTNGSAYATGYNVLGALGDNTTTSRLTPVPVLGLNNVVTTAAGFYHTVFALANGGAYATGYNVYGELGDGTTTDRLTPVAVLGLNNTNVAAISAGYYHSLLLLTDGVALAMGYNGYGQLGDNSTTASDIPVLPLLP